jgi:MFS superfamily sulfate permease-like transporter
MSEELPRKDIIHLSVAQYLIGCLVVATLLFWAGKSNPLPSWLLAVEVCATVIALFVFGSIRFRLDKNALTYGAVFVIVATFLGGWWPNSDLKVAYQSEGAGALTSRCRSRNS